WSRYTEPRAAVPPSLIVIQRTEQMRSRLFRAIMIAPTQLLVLGLILVPGLAVGWLSFHESTYGMTPRYVGLDNYIEILTDRYFWRAFLNTFIIVNMI